MNSLVPRLGGLPAGLTENIENGGVDVFGPTARIVDENAHGGAVADCPQGRFTRLERVGETRDQLGGVTSYHRLSAAVRGHSRRLIVHRTFSFLTAALSVTEFIGDAASVP